MEKLKKIINDLGTLLTSIGAIAVPVFISGVFLLKYFGIEVGEQTINHILDRSIAFYQNYKEEIFFCWIIILCFVIYRQYRKIDRQLTIGFEPKLGEAINKYWDVDGQWSVTTDDNLLITLSEKGGITKKGAFWENYIFSFEGKIIVDCLSIIVRAQDLNDYFMIQITTDSIRPHFIKEDYVSDPVGRQGVPTYNSQNFQRTAYLLSTLVAKHQLTLNAWFKCSVTVNGLSVGITINDVPVFYSGMLPLRPSGKVGFRNFAHEAALVKNVKVRLI